MRILASGPATAPKLAQCFRRPTCPGSTPAQLPSEQCSDCVLRHTMERLAAVQTGQTLVGTDVL